MKTSSSLLVAIALGVGEPAFADVERHEIRVDGGMLGSSVAISDRDGVGFATEIKEMVNSNLAVGGRVELDMMFGGHVGQDNLPLDFTMAACGLVKGEYLFGAGTVRPFVGFGAGLFSIGSHSIQDGPNTHGIHTKVGDYFGVAPQLGVDVGRLRLAMTYHAILGAGIDVHETVGTTEMTTTLSQNYLSLELSFRFGGPP